MRKRGFTLVEMCIVLALGTVFTLGLSRWLHTITVQLTQDQSRLNAEQQAEAALETLIPLLQQTDPATLVLSSPGGNAWGGLRFIVKNHTYYLFQEGTQIRWEVDGKSGLPWLENAVGLHVAVDQLRDPSTLWVAFQVGKNHNLFIRRIALVHPE
jgi:prepilin-type N-terminal cleavage/methylation domain-containing protein